MCRCTDTSDVSQYMFSAVQTAQLDVHCFMWKWPDSSDVPKDIEYVLLTVRYKSHHGATLMMHGSADF